MSIKQVIVMRRDLKMRRGKEMAQAAHASMGAIFQDATIEDGKMVIEYKDDVKTWFEDKFTKIGLRCESEEQLLELYQAAQDAGLRAILITDAGLTEFNGVPTNTCIAIGPNDAAEIDKITGDLKLL